jgi:diacylglycerol kinase family enzyme
VGRSVGRLVASLRAARAPPGVRGPRPGRVRSGWVPAPSGGSPVPCPAVRVVVIVNPRASSMAPDRLAAAVDVLGNGLDVSVRMTRGPHHASELAAAAAADDVDAVVVYAGDGTLNEAANGLAGLATPLAPLPGGSTNVFARAVGYPKDTVPAATVLLRSLLAGHTRRCPLGSVNGRRFLFNCGIGFDAAVVARAERHPRGKRWATQLWYAGAAVSTWMRHWDHDLRFTVHAGGPAEDPGGRSCAFAVVSRISPYTYFGPRPIVVSPAAGLERGLAVIGFERLALPTLARAAVSAMGNGRLLREHPDVHHWADLDRVVVESPVPVPYQIDGEYLGTAELLDLRHEADALTLVLPLRPSA